MGHAGVVLKAASARYLEGAVFAKARYLARLGEARDIQAAVLSEIIARNRETSFGREHHFSDITSAKQFRSSVPLRRYVDLEQWIERAANGESAILTEAPPLLFHRTAGTTGTAKKIPVTQPGAALRLKNARALRASLLECHPETLATADATLSLTINPRVESRTAGGMPWCFISETDWSSLGFPRAPGGPGYGAPWAELPTGDPENSTYYRLRLCVESPLRAILSWFPASILHFGATLSANADKIVRELFDGTVCGAKTRQPNRPRATALESLFARNRNPPLRDVWPELSVVECWKSSTAQLYLPQLQRCLGAEVDIFPCGYGSTESPVAMSIGHTRGALLDVLCAYFEFLPVEEPTCTETFQFFELEPDREYVVVLTTMSGLYRYVLGDVIRVVGFLRGVPLVEFTYRQGVASSLINEKLTEVQICDALAALRPVLGTESSEAGLCPVYSATPYYVVLIEGDVDTSADVAPKLAKILEERLARNISYAFYRSSGLVAAAQVQLLEPGTFAAHRNEQLRGNASVLPQQKHRVIIKSSEQEELAALSRKLHMTTMK